MEDSSYEIFFNRDELRTRQKAHAPAIHIKNEIKAIYPVDPDGNGSWIFTNEFGLSAALLNYNITLPQKDFVSRGTLITEIAFEKTIEDMLNVIKSKNLEDYRGFTVCLFEISKSPLIYRWNGENLTCMPPIQPIMSSSVNIEQVERNRTQVYNDLIRENGDTRKTHLNFHHSHSPEKSYQSTCMHREDAKTVSFSHIIYKDGKTQFSYKGESPCIKTPKDTLIML